MPNLKSATHRTVGEGEEKRKSLTTRKVAKVEEEPTVQKPSRAAICCSNLIQFLSSVWTYCTLRNMGYVLVIGGVSYLSFVIYQNHFNSVQMAETHRQQLLEAQHKTIQTQEKIAEKYYNALLIERKQTLAELTSDAFLKINPQYPCLFGELPVTKQDEKDAIVTDGHKYACGLKSISGTPIIYSLGSKDQDFELGVLKYRPDAEIYVFELKSINLPPEAEQDTRISYYNFGLGYDDPKKVKPLMEMMRMLDHKYIDILKMDIEYAEWHWLARETFLLDRVGQLIIEIHTKDNRRFPYQGPNPGLFFVEKLEEKSLRVYHKEYSTTSKNFVELSMIQKDWSEWEMKKKSFDELPPAYDPASATERYEIEFKIFYGMIPAPTPLPVTQNVAPTPFPKVDKKTRGTIFDVSGATYTNREKLSTNYLKDKILGSAEVYGSGDAPEEPEPVATKSVGVSGSSSFFSNSGDSGSKKKGSAFSDESSSSAASSEDTTSADESLPVIETKTRSSIQSLDDIGRRRGLLRAVP